MQGDGDAGDAGADADGAVELAAVPPAVSLLPGRRSTEDKPNNQGVPGRALAYAVLAVAIVAVSSAGVALKRLDGTPPLLKAHWRLLTTSMLLLPGFVVQACCAGRGPGGVVARMAAPRAAGALLGSGAALALHFGLWIYSLDHTSLAHSLILVVSHPLLVVLATAAARRPVSAGEAAGALVGVGGAAILLLDVRSDGEVTARGDLAAFGGAVAMAVYLGAGASLRSWVPLFLYAFPVTLLASLLLLFASAAVESQFRWSGTSAQSASGYAGAASALIVAYVSVVSGIGGHTGVNYVLSRLPALTVSIALTLEPLFGVLIGVAAGDDSGVPGVFTLVGGPINIAGTIIVVLGTRAREERERAAAVIRDEDSSSADVDV